MSGRIMFFIGFNEYLSPIQIFDFFYGSRGRSDNGVLFSVFLQKCGNGFGMSDNFIFISTAYANEGDSAKGRIIKLFTLRKLQIIKFTKALLGSHHDGRTFRGIGLDYDFSGFLAAPASTGNLIYQLTTWFDALTLTG